MNKKTIKPIEFMTDDEILEYADSIDWGAILKDRMGTASAEEHEYAKQHPDLLDPSKPLSGKPSSKSYNDIPEHKESEVEKAIQANPFKYVKEPETVEEFQALSEEDALRVMKRWERQGK